MTLLAALALAFASPAQSAAAEVVFDPRPDALVTLDGHHDWSFAGDAKGWREEAERIRRQVQVATGLWPIPERAPVRAVLRGEVDRGEYRVQRILLETWPGFFLAGNLYVPARRDARAPAVLSPHGHWRDGRFSKRTDEEVAAELASGAEELAETARFHLQARCVQLARLGCFVFFYDILGYADTQQIGHEDGLRDLEALLHGDSTLGLQTWNSLRALDWLASLEGVDPQRIGVTGASGGGTQTFMLCALDPRPAVAFPAVMVSSDMQGGCICENAPHLRVGITNVAIAALMAPRPLGLSGANDWTLQIETQGLPELRSVYAALGAEAMVEARCWPEFGHNFNRHSREQMYRWFDRHLGLNAGERIRELPFQPLEPPELSVFAAGEALPPEAQPIPVVLASMRGAAGSRFRALLPRQPDDLDVYREVVGGALEVLVHSSLAEVEPVTAIVARPEVGGRTEFLLFSEDARPPVPATLLTPLRAIGTLCIAVSDAGIAALLDPGTIEGALVQSGLETGVSWLAPELLLAEEEARGFRVALRIDDGRHAAYPGYTWGYNRTLIAERVRDLLVAIAAARELSGARRVLLWGEGRCGARALLAAALARERLDGVLVDGGWDFDAICDLADPDFLPGALRYGGLAGFAGLLAPVELRMARVDEAPRAAAACYRVANARLAATSIESRELVGFFLREHR